ncbi:LOW QUALITY PROTEIN: protein ITPRID1 [Ammospiza maritima maritima]
MSPMFQVERHTRIWKSIMSSPWATQPHSALLQGAEVEALESCCRHAGIAAGSVPTTASGPGWLSLTSSGAEPCPNPAVSCRAILLALREITRLRTDPTLQPHTESSAMAGIERGRDCKTAMQPEQPPPCRGHGTIRRGFYSEFTASVGTSLLEFSESPVMSRCKNLSFSHVLTLTGPPQSITEWLLFWEKDPVEILLNLGFGAEEPDVRAKIPPRFLSGVSVAKGFDLQAFLETQKKQMDVERPKLICLKKRLQNDLVAAFPSVPEVYQTYEHLGQLEVLNHVVSALSSLLTHVITQQTKAQDTGRGCLTHQQVPGNKCALAYPTSQCPPITLKSGLHCT